jgi:hypothetical protein
MTFRCSECTLTSKGAGPICEQCLANMALAYQGIPVFGGPTFATPSDAFDAYKRHRDLSSVDEFGRVWGFNA